MDLLNRIFLFEKFSFYDCCIIGSFCFVGRSMAYLMLSPQECNVVWVNSGSLNSYSAKIWTRVLKGCSVDGGTEIDVTRLRTTRS